MAFELQPVLVGELVELRPLREQDFEVLFGIACDPLIWEQHPSSDRYQESVFRDFFRMAMESGGAFLVTDRANGRVIGSSRYHEYSEEKNQVEIGYTFLAREYWGGRYNGEMKSMMLEHAFRFVDRVVFVIGANNIRSRTAVERIGATLAESRTEPNGRASVMYEIWKA